MTGASPCVIESSPLRYLLSLPPGARQGEALPLLCFLHGYDEAAPMAIERALTLHGPLRAESLPRVQDRFIVVAPQLPVAGDHWQRYADAVRQIVLAVQATHGGDPRRTYLTGFSFGANGVLDLARAQPELWAAVWAVDPTRVPPPGLALPVWLSIGEAARPGRARFIRALASQDADSTATGDRLYTDRGEDHVGSATSAYQDERIYAWLLARRSAGEGSP